LALPLHAAELKVKFDKREPGDMLPSINASCAVDRQGKSEPGENYSPALSWSKGPAGTRSYALTMVDPTVPVDRSGFNKKGVTIAWDAKRADFTHWVLADIPAALTYLPQGTDGNGVVKGGLPLRHTNHGRRGQNGFGDGTLKDGPHGGYFGACPPWNDDRIHQYQVTVYALDVERLNLPELFTREDLLAAMKDHILASGTAELRYTLNPRARP
ncbi:MAG: YbhB/YbcL family Raf kinase inhibitor-like protein, partial [Rhizobiaceae bacterium]|nr:YbhB/YbcL family Raf kinase inhibitor-like protein [Rhizobiaceae bacterium]